jgi:acyl-CoA reductase-like NAD-dependent aldehyde dehydrogenase
MYAGRVVVGSNHGDMFSATEEEQAVLGALLDALASDVGGHAELRLNPAQPGLQVPPTVLALLRRAVAEMRHGAAVTVLPVDSELTVEEAAELLNEEPARVRASISSGEIPHRTAAEQRVRLADVLRYGARRNAGRDDALREMTRLGEEHDRYTRG